MKVFQQIRTGVWVTEWYGKNQWEVVEYYGLDVLREWLMIPEITQETEKMLQFGGNDSF